MPFVQPLILWTVLVALPPTGPTPKTAVAPEAPMLPVQTFTVEATAPVETSASAAITVEISSRISVFAPQSAPASSQADTAATPVKTSAAPQPLHVRYRHWLS